MTLKSRIQLEPPKESIRARGLSSPDRADAVMGAPLCLCLASPGAPPWIPSPTWTSGESGSRPARSNSAGSPDYSGPIAPPDGVRQPACPGSGRRIALSILTRWTRRAQSPNAAARSPAIRNNFFGNILREPGLTSDAQDKPARRDFVERLPQREGLLDALAFSAISIGLVERSAQRIWRLRMDLTRHGSTKKMPGTIQFGVLVA